MSAPQKKPNYTKAAIWFTIAVISIIAIVWSYYANVVPAQKALDNANQDLANAKADLRRAITQCYADSHDYYGCKMDKLDLYR